MRSSLETTEQIVFDPGTGSMEEGPLSAAGELRTRRTIEMVRKALDDRRAVLAYQPIVQAGDLNRVAFYEGLIRIRDAQQRIIPARDFIQQVEDTELGRRIDCLALELGLKALHKDPGLRLSINMSARSIGFPLWNLTLRQGLERHPTIGERLILEITEASAMLMPEVVISFMADLQERGIAFALDDFGAGYTAIRYLKDFFFDVLKIDGQFINGIASDPDNQVLTRALVSIAKHFDMFTVAECVETQEDIAMLQDIGIDCLQGYYFGSPLLATPLEQRQKAKKRA